MKQHNLPVCFWGLTIGYGWGLSIWYANKLLEHGFSRSLNLWLAYYHFGHKHALCLRTDQSEARFLWKLQIGWSGLYPEGKELRGTTLVVFFVSRSETSWHILSSKRFGIPTYCTKMESVLRKGCKRKFWVVPDRLLLSDKTIHWRSVGKIVWSVKSSPSWQCVAF